MVSVNTVFGEDRPIDQFAHPFRECRCILPRRRIRTAESAKSTRNSRFLNTRRARTQNKPRVLDATLLNRRVSVVRPSPSLERRRSRPRRSPSDLSALFARSEDASFSEDPSLSSLVQIPANQRAALFSESSNASGKAPPTTSGDEVTDLVVSLFLFNSSLSNSFYYILSRLAFHL
jgi:hypothetical protein